MFYSEAILSKKGPLAKVWLAAHWERKLTKNQTLQTDINNSVDAIMGSDQAPMALRLSGQLLLGVTKIYSRKTKYLLEDCNEALVKIKVSFKSDALNGDGNLLMLDGNTLDITGDHSKATAAAFNAITVPDAMTEFDLLLPAQTIDIGAWGLNDKMNNLSGLRDITLEGSNEDNLLTGNYHLFDHGHRHGLDIEVGRNQMNRNGGRGYDAMDFDLGGVDDTLDLDMLGDAEDFDFLKRPHGHNDLEIEVGRDAAVTRRSASVDPFGMLPSVDKGLRLGEDSEDGRAPSVHGSVHDLPALDDFIPAPDGVRGPVNFEIAKGTGHDQLQNQQPKEAIVKKRKLIVDEETEMSQELLMGTNADLVADGLLTTHEMLPRSRKLLRLQQIQQDAAHGGLAGYLLDCTAGPRVMGSALVPELASMFSRRLQIVPTETPVEDRPVADAQAESSMWQQDQVESWVDQVQDNELDFGVHQTSPPPADIFDEGFQLDSPQKDIQAQAQATEADAHSELAPTKTSLFEEMEETAAPVATTKQLLGTVFSTSTIQTMRLVQQGIESKKNQDQGGEVSSEISARTTRTSSVATASSSLNKNNSTRVTFSELMAGPNKSQQKRSRADAAKLFFELLVLSTKDVVKVKQEKSFGEIAIGGSPWLETLVEADANTAEIEAQA
ncbi:sister chromatid cohesion protein 1 [Lobosporangium transversale]|uniref:Rec8 like protein-domain-containing protein n=1 Tax=Lobosporangium transversale TaxID=64571 RepID=A0A1Y2GKB3_9FUNG|nr:Rec8 like protein-domain-containing protein [Lobosporangium transversale]KAF9915051.1 sister chromatid cohesion protein 1 [Lobosporangium transversale]ORZ13397.1 Rec8 like protein-domain-containing protein [Lobosporangium transversale]|eukprot:XP_021880478.1 Rec8 like protein-domain-containing protein [Lobosporangium transversale]